MGLGKNCLAVTNPAAWPVIAGILIAILVKNTTTGCGDFWKVSSELLWEK